MMLAKSSEAIEKEPQLASQAQPEIQNESETAPKKEQKGEEPVFTPPLCVWGLWDKKPYSK